MDGSPTLGQALHRNGRRAMVADLVLRNANVLTLDPAQPRAQALSVWRGRILAVGDEDRVLEDAGPGTRILDLAGATVLPAFDDAHCHPIGLGLALEWVDVSPRPLPRSRGYSTAWRKLPARFHPTAGCWRAGTTTRDWTCDAIPRAGNSIPSPVTAQPS